MAESDHASQTHAPQQLSEADWARVNRYADDEMTLTELAAFEAELAVRPALRAALASVDRISSALRVLHGPTAEARRTPRHIRPQAARHPSPRTASGHTLRARAAQVAAAALLLVSALLVRSVVTRLSTVETAPVVTDAAQLFERYAAHMQPTVVCDSEQKFARYTQRAFGRRIRADFGAASTAGVVLVGWVYPDDPYGGAGEVHGRRVLLALGPASEPVLVVFQDAEWPTPQPAAELLVKSARLGDVGMHEIGASGSALVLPLLEPGRGSTDLP